MMKKTVTKKILGYIFKILISGGLLWYILTKVPLDDIGATLIDANLFLYCIAFLVTFGVCYLAALQFRMLNLPFGIDLKTLDIMQVNFITSFYTLFLPGYLAGGAVKWVKMQKLAKRPAEFFITIILNRYIELGSVFLMGVFFMIPYLLNNAFYSTFWLLIGISIILIFLYCSAFSKRMLKFIQGFVARLTVLPPFVRNKIEKLYTVITSLHELPFSTHFHIIINCLIRQLLAVGGFLIVARSVSLPVSYGDIAWMRSVVIILGMLPISIGNLGVREASLVVILGQFDVVPSMALSFSVLILLRKIVLVFIGGTLELLGRPRQGDE
ncbi:lysylphosphatidylglycerol synthase transmembrane domain-containing protein [Candidatus Omnitrophota bacterium]